MYSLEGSRRNCKISDCDRVWLGISGATYESGCPFKDFDADTSRNFLHASLTEDGTKKFLNNVTIQNLRMLCTGFLKLVRKDTNSSAINSSVQFYQRMVD